jgi:hypothetical protein
MLGSSAVSNAGSTNSFFWLHSCFSQSILQAPAMVDSQFCMAKTAVSALLACHGLVPAQITLMLVSFAHATTEVTGFTDIEIPACSHKHMVCQLQPLILDIIHTRCSCSHSLARQLQPLCQACAWQQVHIYHSYQARV